MSLFKATWTEHFSNEAIIEADSEEEAMNIVLTDLTSEKITNGPTSEYHSMDDLEVWNIDDDPQE